MAVGSGDYSGDMYADVAFKLDSWSCKKVKYCCFYRSHITLLSALLLRAPQPAPTRMGRGRAALCVMLLLGAALTIWVPPKPPNGDVDGDATGSSPPALSRARQLLAKRRSCSAADVVAANAAAKAWALRSRHPTAPFYSRTLTMGTLAAIHACTALYDGSTRTSDFVIVVMGSAKERGRMVEQQAHWGTRAAASFGAPLLYISDVADAALESITLPGALDPSYAGAQNRSLMGLQHAVETYPLARWYWMVDDDTYVRG